MRSCALRKRAHEAKGRQTQERACCLVGAKLEAKTTPNDAAAGSRDPEQKEFFVVVRTRTIPAGERTRRKGGMVANEGTDGLLDAEPCSGLWLPLLRRLGHKTGAGEKGSAS